MCCEPSARVSDTRATNTQRTVSVMTLYLRVLWDFDVREIEKGNPIRREFFVFVTGTIPRARFGSCHQNPRDVAKSGRANN